MVDEEQRARFNEKQREVFDTLYERFLVPLPPDVRARMERIVAAASIQRGETVLDVGTGTGALIPDIQRYAPRQVIACDLSGKMLEQVARLHPEVERYQGDIRDLQLPDASVDVVFMNGMFGNIVDKPGTLYNTARLLRAGGRAVISHPEGRAYVARLARSEPFPITPLPSADEARALFGAVGMTVTQYIDEAKLLIVTAVKARRSIERPLQGQPSAAAPQEGCLGSRDRDHRLVMRPVAGLEAQGSPYVPGSYRRPAAES